MDYASGLAGKLVSVVSRDPEGADAKQSGRYSVKDFGVQKAAQRWLVDGNRTVVLQTRPTKPNSKKEVSQ